MAQATVAPARVSPTAALGLVLEHLHGSKLTDYSTQRMAELMARFTAYVEKGHRVRSIRDIAEEHVEGFVFASVLRNTGRRPSVSTMHLRRSSMRLYFRIARQLDLYDSDPTVDLVLPPRSPLGKRPLTDDEVALCRSCSLHSLTETVRSAAWALAEATARTSEIPHIAVLDLDIENGRVRLHGSNKADPRWGSLTPWGREQLERRLAALARERPNGERLVAYSGAAPTHSGQAASCIAITEILTRAGLASEPDVRPGSVVAWAGARIFRDTGCIGEVARGLGMRSLDGAARMIGWDWSAPGSGAEKTR